MVTKLDYEDARGYVDRVPFPACIVDGEGVALVGNRGFLELLGISFLAVKSGEWLRNLWPDDRLRLGERWGRFFVEGVDPLDLEIRYTHPARGPLRLRLAGHACLKYRFLGVQDLSVIDAVQGIAENAKAAAASVETIKAIGTLNRAVSL